MDFWLAGVPLSTHPHGERSVHGTHAPFFTFKVHTLQPCDPASGHASAVGFWGMNTRMQMREAETVALLSNNMAQAVSQQLKLYQRSVGKLAKGDQAYLLLRTQDDTEAEAWAIQQRTYLPQNTGVALIDKHNRILGDLNNLGITAKTVRRLRDQLARVEPAQSSSHWFAADPIGLRVIETVPDTGGEPIGFVFASFELRTLQTILEQLVSGNQKVVLRDNEEKLFEVGGLSSHHQTVSAVAPVNDSSLKLELSHPLSDYLIEYLIIGGAIAIMAFATIILTLSNLGLVRTTAAELKRVASLSPSVKLGAIRNQCTAMHNNGNGRTAACDSTHGRRTPKKTRSHYGVKFHRQRYETTE